MDGNSIFEDVPNYAEESAAIESELNDIQLQVHEYCSASVRAATQNEAYIRKMKKEKLKKWILRITVVMLILFLAIPQLGLIVMCISIPLSVILVPANLDRLKKILIYEIPESYNAFVRKYREYL